MSTRIELKRIYADPAAHDGCRILVDRVWPRGLSKEKARLDHWFRELAPGSELRKWFAHDPEKWGEFRRRYESELAANPEPVNRLLEILREVPAATLLYGARDERHNNAVVLRDYLKKKGA